MRLPKGAVLFGISCAAACGPVEYISQVTRRASDAVTEAREANADKYAPYEFTSAVEYLHKAREEEGYADHQAAVRFGKMAEDMAQRATKKALADAAAGNETQPAPTHDGDAAPVIEAPDDPHHKSRK